MQERIEHSRMCGNVDWHDLGVDPICGQRFMKSRNDGSLARHDAQTGAVDHREVEIVRKPAGDYFCWERNAEHRPARNRIEQGTSYIDELDRVAVAHHSRNAGCCIFAHGMADERMGTNAEPHPSSGKGDLDDENGRKLAGRAQEILPRARLVAEPALSDGIAQRPLAGRRFPRPQWRGNRRPARRDREPC